MPPPVLAPGPLHTYSLEDGSGVPFYVIPFDKNGVCTAPQTRSHLLTAARDTPFTDVFLFSHGWNNDWTVATDRYRAFYEGYSRQRRERGDPLPDPYRPLLVGVFWPSTALVFGEAERGPAMAGGAADADLRAAAEDLAEDLSDAERDRFLVLTAKDRLDADEARELAEIAREFYAVGDEFGDEAVPTAAEVLTTWAEDASSDGDAFDDEFVGTVGGVSGGPQAAGLGDWLKKGWLGVRTPIRLLTVYQMKNRAGRVGCRGVGPLLADLLAAGDARVHLVGHSYGGKVVLSALACGGDGPLPRPAESLLLLQPAVNHLCFAPLLDEVGRRGGYHEIPDRVRRPVLATFSAHDSALRSQFHRIPWTKAAIGEPRIAAGDDPPSPYAALGGFGPRRAGERVLDMPAPGATYDLDPGVPIYGLRATERISGHGDISNPATWWALYSLAFGSA